MLESKGEADEQTVTDAYLALQSYFPSWVGYNMARCGGCIRACMENRFKEPLRTGKAWKMDR